MQKRWVCWSTSLLFVLAAASLSTQAADNTAQPYRLSPGDRVSVVVAGQAELTGEFPIDAAGNIAMPLVGIVHLGDLTVDEGREQIARRLQEGYVRNPNVTVKPFELRPIYVFGDVKTAGAYPYRHDAMVLNAVALAGGFGVQDALPNAGADYIAASEAVRVLGETRGLLLIRQARIEAQLAGKADFDEKAVSGSENLRRELIQAEKHMLQQQKAALEEDQRLLGAQIPRINAEKDFVREQQAGETRQLGLLAKQLEEYVKVDGKGFGRSAVTLALQREQARLEGNYSKLQSDLARLELMKGEVDIKLNDLRQGYERRLTAELQDVRTKLREGEANLPAALDLRDVRERQASAAGAANANTGRAHKFFVSRRRGQELTRSEAHEGWPLEPGDILEVVRLPRRDSQTQLSDLKAKP